MLLRKNHRSLKAEAAELGSAGWKIIKKVESKSGCRKEGAGNCWSEMPG